MNKELGIRILKLSLSSFFLCSLFFIPYSAPTLAVTEYTLLQGIPLEVGSRDTEKATAATYLKGLFNLTIAIAGVLAVIKIIFGGIQYMSTDAFGAKSEAKTTIQHAIWGLALALSAWLILHTINPALIQFNFNLPSPVQKTNNTPS